MTISSLHKLCVLVNRPRLSANLTYTEHRRIISVCENTKLPQLQGRLPRYEARTLCDCELALGSSRNLNILSKARGLQAQATGSFFEAKEMGSNERRRLSDFIANRNIDSGVWAMERLAGAEHLGSLKQAGRLGIIGEARAMVQ